MLHESSEIQTRSHQQQLSQMETNQKKIATQILNIQILPSDLSLSQLEKLLKAVTQLDLTAEQKGKIVSRVEAEIKNRQIAENLEKISKSLDRLNLRADKQDETAKHIEKYISRESATWLKVFRCIAIVIILGGVILGGVALFEPQNTQLATGCGITIIATALIQGILEIVNKWNEKEYEKLPREEVAQERMM